MLYLNHLYRWQCESAWWYGRHCGSHCRQSPSLPRPSLSHNRFGIHGNQCLHTVAAVNVERLCHQGQGHGWRTHRRDASCCNPDASPTCRPRRSSNNGSRTGSGYGYTRPVHGLPHRIRPAAPYSAYSSQTSRNSSSPESYSACGSFHSCRQGPAHSFRFMAEGTSMATFLPFSIAHIATGSDAASRWRYKPNLYHRACRVPHTFSPEYTAALGKMPASDISGMPQHVLVRNRKAPRSAYREYG